MDKEISRSNNQPEPAAPARASISSMLPGSWYYSYNQYATDEPIVVCLYRAIYAKFLGVFVLDSRF